MRSPMRFLAPAAIACLLLAGTTVLAQQAKMKTKEKPAAAQTGSKGMDEKAMQAMMALGQPGPQHQILARMVGKWKAVNKMWMGPGEPQESEGTMECTSMLGGRYFHGHYESQFMGQPFEGNSLDGYDNAQHRYFSLWIDNMSTACVRMDGTASPDGKTITYKGKMYDTSLGKEVPVRSVVRWVDDNTIKSEMYRTAGGKESKTMEITYTRM